MLKSVMFFAHAYDVNIINKYQQLRKIFKSENVFVLKLLFFIQNVNHFFTFIIT